MSDLPEADSAASNRPLARSRSWRPLLIIVYLSCLVVGGGVLFGYATIWSKLAEGQFGKFAISVMQSVLAAGILGFLYELLVREANQRDQENLLIDLRQHFGAELRQFGEDIKNEVARTPLALDESVDLLSEERRIDVVRKIFADNVGSREVGDAVLRTVHSAIGERSVIWRETSHTVEFQDAEDVKPHGLIRVTDRVSYKSNVHRNQFRVGLLRAREVRRLMEEGTDLDAFWLVPRAFVGDGAQAECLASFEDFALTAARGEHRPTPRTIVLDDGSRLLEYDIPHELIGEECRVSYLFRVIADAAAPYLHLAVPCPSLGFHALLRNRIKRLKRMEERVFVPNSADMMRDRIGEDVLELRTTQMLLRGHGAVIFLR